MNYSHYYNYNRKWTESFFTNSKIHNISNYIEWIKQREINRRMNIMNQTLLATLGYNIFFLIRDIEKLRREVILSEELKRWKRSGAVMEEDEDK